MIKILMHGANGAMGRVISELLVNDEKAKIVAGVDIQTETAYGYPIYKSLNDVKEDIDVIIDFSHISAMDSLFDYVRHRKIPLVLCTTGLSKGQIEKIEYYSKEVAILRSANMSLGINLLLDLVAKAAKVLSDKGFDMEIVEAHHRRKLDAPSGTALALADAINEALENSYVYAYERANRHESRPQKEIGISAVRGGTIVGIHDVIYAGEDEVVTLSHTAYSRKIFAKGAISAAIYLADKQDGLYTMSDVINA